MHATRTPLMLPVLVSGANPARQVGAVLDAYFDDISVAYSYGPPYGDHLVTWADLESQGLSLKELRASAAANLEEVLDEVQVHGKPPVLMLSFAGIGSTILLADDFWERVALTIPGDLVVGVPARDVVMMTGTESPRGLDKIRGAVDRLFYAGGDDLLLHDLLVRREGRWEVM